MAALSQLLPPHHQEPTLHLPATTNKMEEFQQIKASAPAPDPLNPPAVGARPPQQQKAQGNGHSTNQSLYQCAYCLRRYSRPEHLQRHIATHTLGKRFLCDVCGKAFGRGDLLKRHRQNHEEDPTGTKRRRVTSTAGRVTSACQACARARVKCDEIKPCARCKSRNQTCEYSSADAGSAAAMHLLHLSAPAPHGSVSPDTARRHSPSQSLSPTPSPQQPQPRQVADHQPTRPGVLLPQGQFRLPIQTPVDPQLSAVGTNPLATHAGPSSDYDRTPISSSDDVVMGATAQSQDASSSSSSSFVPPPAQYGAAAAAASNGSSSNGATDSTLPFSYFMRDVLYEELDPSRLVGSQGLSVLDFNANSSMELNERDFGLLDQWSGRSGAHDMRQQAHGGADLSQMRRRLVKSWTESPLRWNPNNQDSGYCEQANLTVPSEDAMSATQIDSVDRVITDRLDPSVRDRVLAVVLSECQGNDMLTRVASSFPTTEVLDSLCNIFVASHLSQVSSWLHLPTFKLNETPPELIAAFVAAGAALCPNTTLRRFGQALQEVVRLTLPKVFEESYLRIQDIPSVQSLILSQDLGLWSGYRRKMEIAECHLNIPITMMRYRNKFKRSFYVKIPVTPQDQGEELEKKWKRWTEQESWKRLVFHCYLRDAQTSLTTLTPTNISYAELTTPLPEARQLWFASSAREWQTQTLSRASQGANCLPSLVTLFQDIGALARNRHRLDVQYAISIYLHGVWTLIWELRQLAAVQRHSIFSRDPSAASPSKDPFQLGAQDAASLLLKSRHHEICKMLEDFSSATSDWNEFSAQESLTLNLLQMHLHVSLDELQILSGRENEEQARRVYIHLQTWVESEEARRALWHAGQVLRLAKLFPTRHLKGFHAIGVHHAALTIWTYGIIKVSSDPNGGLGLGELVHLDGPQTAQVTQFINFGHGCPAIRGPTHNVVGNSGNLKQDDERQQQEQKYGSGGGQAGGAVVAPISDSQACMEIAQQILRANNHRSGQEEEEPLVPIVENLCHVLTQLRNAARAVAEV